MVTDASRGRRRQQEAHLFESLSLQNNTGDAEEGLLCDLAGGGEGKEEETEKRLRREWSKRQKREREMRCRRLDVRSAE